MSVERQIEVNAPAEKVFAYVADITRHPEWAAHPLAVESGSPGPVAVGSSYRCEGHQMGTHKGEVTVTELVPNQKVVYESDDDTGRFRHWFSVTAGNGGTVLAKGFEPVRPGTMFKVMGPVLMAFVVPRGLEGDLKRIRSKMEATA